MLKSLYFCHDKNIFVLKLKIFLVDLVHLLIVLIFQKVILIQVCLTLSTDFLPKTPVLILQSFQSFG